MKRSTAERMEREVTYFFTTTLKTLENFFKPFFTPVCRGFAKFTRAYGM